MQRLLDFLATATNAVLAKLKRLALHIIKHPLGSIWWTVKMYFALMFFSLFVACSFGAFAQSTIGTCAVGTPIEGVGCSTPAKIGAVYKATRGTDSSTGSSASEAFGNFLKMYMARTAVCKGTGSESRSLIGEPQLAGGPVNFSASFNVKFTCTWQQYNSVTGNYETQKADTNSSVTGISISPTSGPICPPNDQQAYELFTNITKHNGLDVCTKPFDLESCFSDPKYSLANQYHFAPQDAGKGSVCVGTDNGQLCPWKELAGSNGVFSPDTDSTTGCSDEPPSDPMPPPPEPPECTTTPSGMKVCKEDPNEKCTANSSNAMSCPPSCGYMNNVFVCFENPDVDPEQPEEPDTPRPPADDNIENPDKPIADMLKKDFKDVQRGVESRLDGFAADMANLIKTEKAAKDQENKNSALGNKLLNSINQNTADTVKELKKITEPGEAVEGIEKPEFDDNKNDWQQRNFGTVMKAKGDEIMNLPIMNAISNFFDVSFSGSCPTYAVTVWVFEINIDQFCSPQVQALFPYISAVVLLMCSFFAIRIALL